MLLQIVSAATGPAICIILASYAGCDRFAAVAYFIASMALMGGFYSGMKVRFQFILSHIVFSHLFNVEKEMNVRIY